jgi:hypothetical protein
MTLPVIAVAAFGGTAVLAIALSRPLPPPLELTGTRVTCATSSLAARVTSMHDPGAVYYLLEFTNRTGQSCELAGYPRVAAYGGAGEIGSPAVLDTSVRPGRVTLAPGGTAHAVLRYTRTAALRSSACAQVTAPELRIYLPGQVRAMVLSWREPACSRQGPRFLEVQPVAPWTRPRGATGADS